MGLNYTGKAAEKDIAKYVDVIFRNNEEIRSAYRSRSIKLPDILKQEVAAGIQDAINNFICEQKRETSVASNNIFDMDLNKFLSKDYIRKPITDRVAENVEIRKQFKRELVLNTFDCLVDNIAYIVSESYRGHMLRLFMDETGLHASRRGTKQSSK